MIDSSIVRPILLNLAASAGGMASAYGLNPVVHVHRSEHVVVRARL